jgi:adenine-specific DNA-methyltransferase
MKITTLDGKTPDIAEENIQKLKQLFPEVFTESKVDFEKLKQVLGEYVEDSNERYNFTWNGKGRALRLSQTPSLGTLRPCKEESKDWDTTQNLYIEGDNLEVLKLLQKSYYGKVKMIYIDPPYNTGKDFVYKDDFHDSLENYKRITGQVDGNGKAISTNTETSGRYHTDWLNMMYPRLRLARNLLTDDGVIFISIDDNEVHNLRKICDEVFGEDNFINCFIWNCSTAGGIRPKFASKTHEYILFYAMNKEYLPTLTAPLSEQAKKMYTNQDSKGLYRNKDFVFRNTSNNINQKYFIKCPDGEYVQPKEGYIYRFIKSRFEEALKNDEVTFIKTNAGPLLTEDGEQAHWNIYIKKYLGDGMGAPSTLIPKEMMSIYNVGTQCVQTLFNGSRVFENVKPVDVIYYFLKMASNEDSIVLDFFSGSATTAHAVMQLNAEDGGNRKFIMVQLPEPTDEKSEAYKAGYMNICEIGKERIRRAGEKIKEENKDKENIENLDVGFKVLKLDTSNIRKWQPDYENLEQSLLEYVDNYVEGRTELDVVYEIMLKYGLDLTYPVDEFTIAQKKVYSIGFGMLMICLDNEITTEVAKGIIAKIKELSPESSRVVFKDNGFKSDSNKTNIKEILKSGGIEEFITI